VCLFIKLEISGLDRSYKNLIIYVNSDVIDILHRFGLLCFTYK